MVYSYVRVHGAASLLLAMAVLPKIFAPLEVITPIYEPLLVIFFLRNLVYAKGVNLPCLLFLLVAALSIVCNDTLPVFKAWYRLVFFILLLGAVGPLFHSRQSEQLRQQCFHWVMKLCVLVGALSFPCSFLGINYMRYSSEIDVFNSVGSFGGLTSHSMTLASIAAVGAIYALYPVICQYREGRKVNFMALGCGMMCLCSMLIASSRGAFVACIAMLLCMLFSKSRKRVQTIIVTLLTVCFALSLFSFFDVDLLHNLSTKQRLNIETGSTFSSRSAIWEDRWSEFLSSPFYGIGFCCQKIVTYASTLRTGIIEPGSSYFACLAFTGFMGFSSFICILASSFLVKCKYEARNSTVHVVRYVFGYFCIHMLIEGYAFSAGSESAFILWLCIGTMFAKESSGNSIKASL